MKNLFLLLIPSLLIAHSSLSQADSAWKYAQTITDTALKNQLSIVASAQMEGRETGTEGQKRAADYIKAQFKKTGLKSPGSLRDYQQMYPLLKDTLIPKILKIGKRRYDFGSDYPKTMRSFIAIATSFFSFQI